jgi:hypothetical protein
MNKVKYFIYIRSFNNPKTIYRQTLNNNGVKMQLINNHYNQWQPAINNLSDLERITKKTAKSMYPKHIN